MIRTEHGINQETGAGARRFFTPVGEWVREHLEAGRNVGVHCLGLHHRSPLTLLGLVLYLRPGAQHASPRPLEGRHGAQRGLRVPCACARAASAVRWRRAEYTERLAHGMFKSVLDDNARMLSKHTGVGH